MHQSRGDHVIQYANDRYCHGRLLACADCRISRATEERIDFIFDQCGGAFHEQLGTPFPVDNLEVLSLHKASAAQLVKKWRVTGVCSRSNDEYTDAIGAARLLGVYRQRQSRSHTTDEPNELAPVAVGTRVASRPLRRSARAAFPHTAPTSGV